MVTGLDIRHDVGGGDHPLLGRRLPERELVVDGEKISSFSLLHPGRAVLLDLSGGALHESAAAWRDRIDVVTAEFDCDVPVDGILVRPDGYVAWVAPTGAGADGLAPALTRWFGPAA
jgi:hypothetical protein